MMYLLIWKLLAICLIFPLWGENTEKILLEAQVSYQQGEKATTYEERKLAFNQALFLFSTLEQEIKPHATNLDQAIADTYFQLGEYAWAILYYQRALKKDSHQELLLTHLKGAQQKLGLSESVNQKSWSESFFPLSKQFQLLFWTIFITFLAVSCAIWLPFYWIRYLAAGSTCLLLLLLSFLLFSYYFKPFEGILVKTTGLYRAPNWDQPQLTNQPLLEGSKVQILQITNDGNWLKIESPAGIIGYIPVASLRPI